MSAFCALFASFFAALTIFEGLTSEPAWAALHGGFTVMFALASIGMNHTNK